MKSFKQFLTEAKKLLDRKLLKMGAEQYDKCNSCKAEVEKGAGGMYDGWTYCDDCMEEIEIQLDKQDENF